MIYLTKLRLKLSRVFKVKLEENLDFNLLYDL